MYRSWQSFYRSYSSFLDPPHFRLTPQLSLWLVIPVEDHPHLTLGQEMVKSSLAMPHTSSPYKWHSHMLGFRIAYIVAHGL